VFAAWIGSSDSQWGDADARSSFLPLFDKAFEQFCALITLAIPCFEPPDDGPGSPMFTGAPRIARRKSLYGLDGVDGQDVIHGIVASATEPRRERG
jgi:hypothetical protein